MRRQAYASTRGIRRFLLNPQNLCLCERFAIRDFSTNFGLYLPRPWNNLKRLAPRS
ncbi:hypothetical protein GW17_00046423, partial [Ensete ventricosum]